MEEESLGGKKDGQIISRKSAEKTKENVSSMNWMNTGDSWIDGSYRILILFAFLILLSLQTVNGQSPPPNYNYKKLPETRFTCEDKATGGYYADPEAGCQMFHVCLRVSEEQINDFKFLCPNNTVFDQQNFICTNWWEIDCQRSTRYYNKNDLFRLAEETTTAEPEYEQQAGYYEYVYEYIDPEPREKNTTIQKLPEPSHRLSRAKTEHINVEVTTTKRTVASFDIRRTKIPPEATTVEVTTPEPETTPQVTTFRYNHRFAYQSDDNIGKRAYQPENRKHMEKAFVINSHRRRGKKRLSKSFDSRKEQSQIKLIKTDKTDTSNFFSETNKTNSSLDNTFESKIKTKSSTVIVDDIPSSTPRVKALRRKTNRRYKTIANKPKEKHKEFSNFRFYKTAFGRSYSSDDYLHTTTTTTPRNSKRRARFRRPKRVRSGRTASRNTRYSKYGR